MVTTLFLRVTFYGMVPATTLTKSNTLAYPIFEFYLDIFAISLVTGSNNQFRNYEFEFSSIF